MWDMGHETRGVAPLPCCSGTCQAQGLPERHNPSYKTLLSFSTSAFEVLTRAKRKPCQKARHSCPYGQTKCLHFIARELRILLKKKISLFYLVGKSYSTLIYTNTLLEMSRRDTGRVVRARPKKFMKMSKMILLKSQMKHTALPVPVTMKQECTCSYFLLPFLNLFVFNFTYNISRGSRYTAPRHNLLTNYGIRQMWNKYIGNTLKTKFSCKTFIL